MRGGGGGGGRDVEESLGRWSEVEEIGGDELSRDNELKIVGLELRSTFNFLDFFPSFS